MDCIFEQVDNRYVCENCKFATLIPKLKRNCRPAAPPQLPVIPSASRQAFNFTVASIRHVMGGMPTRSQQEIDAMPRKWKGGRGGLCDQVERQGGIRSANHVASLQETFAKSLQASW